MSDFDKAVDQLKSNYGSIDYDNPVKITADEFRSLANMNIYLAHTVKEEHPNLGKSFKPMMCDVFVFHLYSFFFHNVHNFENGVVYGYIMASTEKAFTMEVIQQSVLNKEINGRPLSDFIPPSGLVH